MRTSSTEIEETNADFLDYGIEVGIDFCLRIYPIDNDDEPGNYAVWSRHPRININGKLYELPDDIRLKMQEILEGYSEDLDIDTNNY